MKKRSDDRLERYGVAIMALALFAILISRPESSHAHGFMQADRQPKCTKAQ